MDNASSTSVPTDDQFFLLYLIMGIYFGPDLKEERPKKSALRRFAEGLLPYTSDQLAGTCIRTAEVERLYYCILRKAHQSVIVALPLLYQFFHGILPTPVQGSAAAYPQINDLFPPGLHPIIRLNNGYNVIENIAFVNDPDVSYISPEYLERFKKLTGLQHFLLDGDYAGLLPFLAGKSLNNVAAVQGLAEPEDLLQPAFIMEPVSTLKYYETPDQNRSFRGTAYDRNMQFDKTSLVGHLNDAGPLTCTFTALSPSNTNSEGFDHAMLVLPTRPSNEEWNDIVAATKRGYAITGSAANGQIGPVLGLLDIGECDDAYLFRISLPGVKRDERVFCCEVENDGKVLIKGVTTEGEKTVCRYSQVFEMQSQNLCPSGHFSMSFKLPGPVNPQQFSGTFGTDAILEGIVMKAEHNRTGSSTR